MTTTEAYLQLMDELATLRQRSEDSSPGVYRTTSGRCEIHGSFLSKAGGARIRIDLH